VIEGLFDTGSLPVLERVVQFTHARHRVLADNIANLSTPNFRPREMSVDGFQAALADAVDRRRAQTGGPNAPLEMKDTPDLNFGPSSITQKIDFADDNILFHDRNNRSLEHTMQALAENAMVHNAAIEMIKSEFGLLQTASQERV